MSYLLEKRKPAAKLIYVRGDEVRFDGQFSGILAIAALAIRKLKVNNTTHELYARSLMESRIEGVDDEALLKRVQADLAANGVDVPFAELQAEMIRTSAWRDETSMIRVATERNS